MLNIAMQNDRDFMEAIAVHIHLNTVALERMGFTCPGGHRKLITTFVSRTPKMWKTKAIRKKGSCIYIWESANWIEEAHRRHVTRDVSKILVINLNEKLVKLRNFLIKK